MIIHNLGLTDYASVYDEMHHFTNSRDTSTPDEIWITEHFPVFTQGLAGKPEHILVNTSIPIIQTDRGGQVTFHGPKQMVFYPLLNIKRLNLGPRRLVSLLEESTINTLTSLNISAHTKPEAPGVYVYQHNIEKKIASLGLRIRKGCCYHGLSLNIDMDLTPFEYINPCGYQGLKMANISMFCKKIDNTAIISNFTEYFLTAIRSTKEAEVSYNIDPPI